MPCKRRAWHLRACSEFPLLSHLHCCSPGPSHILSLLASAAISKLFLLCQPEGSFNYKSAHVIALLQTPQKPPPHTEKSESYPKVSPQGPPHLSISSSSLSIIVLELSCTTSYWLFPAYLMQALPQGLCNGCPVSQEHLPRISMD